MDLGDKSNLLDTIKYIRENRNKAKQIRDIVPPGEWISSPYYYGAESETVFDFWKEKFIEFYSGKYDELLITGSLGSGKTSFGLTCLLYKLYLLSCYDNAPALFGISLASEMVISYLSITKEQAKYTGFGKLQRLLDSIPYFRDHYRRDAEIDSLIRFPGKPVLGIPGSDASHFTGTDLYMVFLDEGNFLNAGAGEKFGKAQNIYRESTNRRKARFYDKELEDQGLSIIVSSADTQSSFMESRIKEGRNDKNTYIVSANLIDVKPGNYSPKKFFVFTGTEDRDPVVMSKENYNMAKDILVDLDYAGDLDDRGAVREFMRGHPDMFVSIPLDFWKQFKIDVSGALREVAGRSVATTGRLYYSKENWFKAVKRADEIGLEHPFTKKEIVISTGDNKMIQDYFVKEKFKKGNYKYYVRIDQSTKKDSTGIALSHAVPRPDGYPEVVFDFFIRINPPTKPHSIDIAKCHNFIIWLRKTFKIKIEHLTADRYQSEQGIQFFNQRGIKAEFYSVDRTDEAYTDFTYLLNAGLVTMYDYEFFRREFFLLEHDRVKGKVDHPYHLEGELNSKDVSDAAVGCARFAILKSLGKQYGTIDRDTLKMMATNLIDVEYDKRFMFLKDKVSKEDFSKGFFKNRMGKHAKHYSALLDQMPFRDSRTGKEISSE